MMDETFYKANQLVILSGIPGFESAGRRNCSREFVQNKSHILFQAQT
jgi:hypothetical protein